MINGNHAEPSYWPDPVEELGELAPEAYIRVGEVITSLGTCLKGYRLNQALEAILYSGAEPLNVVPAATSAAALRFVIAHILEARDAKLAAKCLALAVGLVWAGGEDATISGVAIEHGISRQSVSKRVRDLQTELGISASCFGKRSLSRETYRLSNHRHAKLANRQ